MKSILGILLFFSPISFAATSQTIVVSHRAALEVTKAEKMAPPYAAMMWAIANRAAVKASAESQNQDLAYRAAFSRVLAKIKPNQVETAEGWLNRADFSPEQEQVIRDAQSTGERIYLEHAKDLEMNSRPNSPPWDAVQPRGVWRPTLPQFAQPALPYWGEQEFWSKASISELSSGLQADPVGSQKAKQEILEVYRIGGQNSNVRTKDQTIVAKFWVGGAGTVTPPGLWVLVALQRIQEEQLSFSAAEKLMLVLTSALSDAGVAAWWVKYDQITWRPITAIQEEFKGQNWLPLLATPPFPSYVSGHSTFSAAAAVVLSHLLPLKGKTLRIESPDLPGTVRYYKSYSQAANEAGMSRIYGGIHYAADNRDGLILGSRVACAMLESSKASQCPAVIP